MNCNTCKFFNQADWHPKHLGWCDLDLPIWLCKAVGFDKYEVEKEVRIDDTCSFYKETV